MFKSKKLAINPNTTDTLVGEGTVFEGNIKSQATIRIEGQLIGDIDCSGDVIIGEKGRVRSNITAREVVLAGHLSGNVTARGKLTITATGSLSGNIAAAVFTIEEGGVFQGTSRMEVKSSHQGDAPEPNIAKIDSNEAGSGQSAAM